MTSSSDWTSETTGIVVAYFFNGEDAQNAIDELVDEEISVRDIGAAFHGSGKTSQTAGTGAIGGLTTRAVQEESSNVGAIGSGAGVGGAGSDTSGVTPAGLSTGGGTGFSGASRPGPIPGSDIPASVPRDLPDTERSSSTAPLSESTGMASAGTAAEPVYSEDRSEAWSEDRREYRSQPEESWWDKLKHLFSGESPADPSARRAPASESSSRKFGTGEGELGLSSDHDYPYSGSAFESAFTGMGIAQEHARHLATEIQRGGAIVTVSAGSKAAEAEAILERNHGRIRYEAGTSADEALEDAPGDTRIRVFGHVQRVYPGYISSSQPTRKAS